MFIGDSITEQWAQVRPFFFRDHGFLNRGMGGQTTHDVRARFLDEIGQAEAGGVHLLCGINDIAENGGPMPLSVTQDNLAWMIDRAAERGCTTLVGAVTPADVIAWNRRVQPAARITELNEWLGGYARARGAKFIDYHALLRTPTGALRPGLGTDGLHLNARGYRVIEPALIEAVTRCFGTATFDPPSMAQRGRRVWRILTRLRRPRP